MKDFIIRLTCLFCIVIQSSDILFAQTKETHCFSPNYTLPGKAANLPGSRADIPVSRFQLYKQRKLTPDFHQMQCTEALNDFVQEPLTQPMAIEFALVHHFNKPAGLVLYFEKEGDSALSFGYFSQKDNSPAEIGLYDWANERSLFIDTVQEAFQEYWHHFVLMFDKNSCQIFHNGKKVGEVEHEFVLRPYDLKIAAYLQEEPYGKMQNLLSYVTLWHQDVEKADPAGLFNDFKDKIDKGLLYADIFHFNAGPYLNYATDSSINILWETNNSASAIIEYGEELPLNNKVVVKNTPASFPYIYETTLGNLEPDKKYFYNIKVESENGEKMESGVLTFKTASIGHNPILFGLIGDTEARPHINDMVARKLWGERPEFVMVLGDLTDGGMQDAKWQWNLEYFTGMTQLFSRITAFPVPGNGEGDLYWYKKYHVLPDGEAYYTFKYGDAEFFMLNSNERKTEFTPGGEQYEWLDSMLARSDARWKFAAMHHAPYSTDEDDYGNSYSGKSNLEDEQVRPLVPLFEKHHVDAVFFGHLHSYNRIGPIRNNKYDNNNGVWYIQSGGAGGNTEDFAPTRSWFSKKNYAGHHYCTISLNEHEMVLKTYNLEGQLIDFMTITK